MATVVGRGIFTVNGWVTNALAIYQRGAGRVINDIILWGAVGVATLWFIGIPLLTVWITIHVLGETDDD
jgi:hypothetical protein